MTLSKQQHLLVPVLGAWHYCWHLVKAIFILYGDWLLIPISIKLGWRKIRMEADNYHACCTFLISLIRAGIAIIQKFNNKSNILGHYQETKKVAVMYSEMVYFIYAIGVPLCMTLTAVRSGDLNLLQKCVTHNLRLFLAAHKKHYSFLFVHFIWVTNKLSEKALQIYSSNLWFKLSSHSKYYSANDVTIENVINILLYLS